FAHRRTPHHGGLTEALEVAGVEQVYEVREVVRDVGGLEHLSSAEVTVLGAVGVPEAVLARDWPASTELADAVVNLVLRRLLAGRRPSVDFFPVDRGGLRQEVFDLGQFDALITGVVLPLENVRGV